MGKLITCILLFALPALCQVGHLANQVRRAGDDGARPTAEALEELQRQIVDINRSLDALDASLSADTVPTSGIPNVSITTANATYDVLTDNGSIKVKVEATLTLPTPRYDLDRVYVIVEIPGPGDPTPLDPTGGPLVDAGEFPISPTSTTEVLTFFLDPPTVQEGWRIYAISGSTEYRNPLRLSASTFPTPNYLLTVDPIPEGGSGTEWVSNVTSFTATVEYAIDQVGALVWRVYGTYAVPADDKFYGVRIVGRYGSDDIQLDREPRQSTAYISPWQAVPDTQEIWTIFAQSIGPNSRLNTIVPGTTPSQNVTIEDQAGLGGLRLNRIDSTTFDTSEFEITGGNIFAMKYITADKIVTGTLKVGGGGSKPGQLGVFDAVGSLIGWIGEQGAYYGGWMKQLWVGGTDPTNAPFYVDAGANVVLSNVGAYEPSISLAGTNFDVDINSTDGIKVGIDGGTYIDTEAKLDADSLTVKETASTYPIAAVRKDRVSVVSGLDTGLMGAFMDIAGTQDSGRLWVSEGLFGGTTAMIDGWRGSIELAQRASYTPPGAFGAIQNQSGDLYWYKTGTGWQQINGVGGVSSVTGTTPIVASPTTGAVVVSCSTCVTTNTTQTISGSKTFSSSVKTTAHYEVDGFQVINATRAFVGSGGVATAGVITATGGFFDVDPSVDNTWDQGTASVRWRTIFGETADFATGYKGPSGTIGTSIALVCNSGDAVTAVTISGGIVTAITCSTP
ncbi:MAG: hypothetical protein ACYSUI_16945 [Planctomycetota bacterium]|jgi:hypothetical protein